jgi:rubredoxin
MMGRLFNDLLRGERESMAKYRCTICGYIYDPAEGDSTQGINPGTAFESIPDDWNLPGMWCAQNRFCY